MPSFFEKLFTSKGRTKTKSNVLPKVQESSTASTPDSSSTPLTSLTTKNDVRVQYARTLSDEVTDKHLEVENLQSLSTKCGGTANLSFGTKQEDVTEFLLPAFDALYDNPPLTLISTLSPRNSPPNILASIKNDEVNTLDLEIDGSDNVKNIVENFQITEALLESESYKDFQSSETEVLEEHLTDKQNKLIVDHNITEISVTLKRFKTTNSGLNREKNDKDVVLNAFDLDDNLGCKKTFEPTAFILHTGTLTGGHYVSYIKEKTAEGTDQWFLYNDETKTLVHENAVNEAKKKAYVVKYSTADEGGSIPLPQAQNPVINAGNTCWANAGTAYLGSFTSFQHYRNAYNASASLVDNKTKMQQAAQVKAHMDESSTQVKRDKINADKAKQLEEQEVQAAIMAVAQAEEAEQARKDAEARTAEQNRKDAEVRTAEQAKKQKEPLKGSETFTKVFLEQTQLETKLNYQSEAVKYTQKGEVGYQEFQRYVEEKYENVTIDKLAKHGGKVDNATFALVEKEIQNKDNVFPNKLRRALENVKKAAQIQTQYDGIWKNITTLDRRILVDHYNQNSQYRNIDFLDLYKETSNPKSELRVQGRNYSLDPDKSDDLQNIINYAIITAFPTSAPTKPKHVRWADQEANKGFSERQCSA